MPNAVNEKLQSRNTNLQARNAKIYERYKELYDINFLRFDKVIEMLATEFYLGQQSIKLIILNQKKEVRPVKSKDELQACNY